MEITNEQVNEFRASFAPFGYADIETAIDHALHAGKTIEWATEQAVEFSESYGTSINDVDVVYCVLDSILQESRNEIESLTGFNIQNDANFETYGNYMCSSFDFNDESLEKLKAVLKKKKVIISQLSQTEQYFLSEIGIMQEDISTKKRNKKEKVG